MPSVSPDGAVYASRRPVDAGGKPRDFGFALEAITTPLRYDELVARLRSVLNGSGNIYQIEWHPERFGPAPP